MKQMVKVANKFGEEIEVVKDGEKIYVIHHDYHPTKNSVLEP